ncbi:Hypothetical Protein FCC1311_103352 [Hondaea fermentalgiana]|uniref:Uncharacterized protein n=1 Tax=Hondaea fermentalgiana TaxID=2315210 RepID=A0A2R5GTC4_9STRA|nr:Hypothetical Protein FCC1311_103352 [Hondaea fermentalgiana]|eukprot:GBG34112.1 Hypothetical Protein FCC1311_103352 [Hondaea fermentalgiana]
MDLVVVDVADLADPRSPIAQDAVSKALGPHGLGALAVRGVDGYIEARKRLLPLARTFGKLDVDVQRQFEVPERHYQFGWSHGKETLEDGSPDLRKGSFYANPFHVPLDSRTAGATRTDDNEADANLSSAHNVWPTREIPELEPAMEHLCELMRATANLVAQTCDAYLELQGVSILQQPLARVTVEPTAAKGRLLYYYPETPGEASRKDSGATGNWCGWHSDHGSITCLTKAMYFDEEAPGDVAREVRPQQDDLRIRTRSGREVVVQIPEDCIAFQVGQAAQIESGCWLGATPHCVTLTSKMHLSRCTFALFLQPAARDVLQSPHPRAPGVPLPIQYAEGMTFGEFTAATLNMIYASRDSTTEKVKQDAKL